MLASEARARARRGGPRVLSCLGSFLGAAAVCAGCVLSFDGLTGGARPGEDAGPDDAGGASPRADGGAADVDSPDTDAADVAPTTIFNETFDGPAFDVSKWIVPYLYTDPVDMSVMVDLVDQRLRIGILSSLPGGRFSGITTRTTHDLRGARVSVRLAVRPSGGAGAIMTMALGQLEQARAYAALVENGHVTTIDCIPGSCETPVTAPVAMQDDTLVAIRHDTTTDEIVWEVAPPKADGPRSWSEVHRAKRRSPLTSALIELKAGTYTAVPDAGFAAIDDLLVER